MLETGATGFVRYVRGNYLIGDQAVIRVFPYGKAVELKMAFATSR